MLENVTLENVTLENATLDNVTLDNVTEVIRRVERGTFHVSQLAAAGEI
jgi:hypothetical protein